MKLNVRGAEAFASTGGRDFDPSGEVIIFIHGSGQSRLCFQLQHRFLANRGWQVLSPDLPGHGLSGGSALPSIEAQADWIAAFLEATGVESAHVAGHSQGGLVALELARRQATKARSLIFMATALAIPVNEA
ncbi:MAG: alpha/beta fold hydrolase, partial [Pseudomonadota bacterium]